MTLDPVTVLDRLVREAPGSEEHHPDVPGSLYHCDWSGAEIGALEVESALQYASLVQQVTAVWGLPAFEGGRDAPAFPPWSEAVRVAYWRRDDRLAYVAYRYSDHGLPVLVVLGAVTEQEAGGGPRRSVAVFA